MKKKTSLFLLLPAVAMIASSCDMLNKILGKDKDKDNTQQTGGNETGGEGSGEGEGGGQGEGEGGGSGEGEGGGQGETGQAERQKFDEIVSNLKSTHNYTLSISSAFENDVDEQGIEYHRYNLNDKAWYHDDSIFDAEGVIYQKDQGYVTFAKSGSQVIPMNLNDEFHYETDKRIFVSTNPQLKISDIYETIGENLFIGEYTQDATDKTKFVSTSLENRTVAAYFTQYTDYIGLTFQVDDKITAVLDSANSEITLSMDYWIAFYDEGEKNEKGNITIKIEKVGTTTDSVIFSYIENPTTTFTAPEAWPTDMTSEFVSKNNGVTPTLPAGLCYATVFGEFLYDGFYYAGIQDLNSGDLRTSYGTTLVNDGFTKVSDNSYKKVVANGMDSITYRVEMKYKEANEFYKKGEMLILYRAIKQVGVFGSIAEFNEYLSNNRYDELVPALPAESTCTSITNVKDQTPNDAIIYALKMNSTDSFKVNIPSFAKAKAFAEAYGQLLIDKGFSSTSSFLSMTNYSLESSSSGTYVGIDCPQTEAQYTGFVGVRYVIYKADEQSLRPAQKHSVSASNEMVNGSISFNNGTQYAAGSTVNFTISPKTGYKVSSASIVGKDITVSLNGNAGSFVMPNEDVVVLVSFVELPPAPTYAINFTCEHFTVDHFEDEGGNRITSYTYVEGAYGIFAYGTFEQGYEFDSLTVEGDVGALGASWYDDDCGCDVIQVYVTKQLDEFNITVLTKQSGVTPEPTVYSIGKESVEGATITVAESLIESQAGQEISFTVAVSEGYEFESVAIKNHSEVAISKDVNTQTGVVTCSFIMPEFDVVITASVTPVQPTSYAITKDSVEGLTIKIVGFMSEAEACDYVRFTVSLDEDYTLVKVFIKDHPEISIDTQTNPLTQAITYMFEMPAFAVTISGEVLAPEVAQQHQVTSASVQDGSILFNKSYYEEGETVEFTVSPNTGYQIDEVSTNPALTIADKGSGQYSFEMPNGDVVISATFSLIPTPEPGPHAVAAVGDVYDGGTKVGRVATWFKYVSVKAGEMAYVTITPSEGYEIVRAYVEGHEEITLTDASATMGSNKWGFEMPAYDVTITAEFRLIPKELSSITLSGQKTEFKVNDSFTVGELVVKASYTNGENESLVSYDVDSSQVKMNEEGNYQVTISYTYEGVTKSQSYTISVKGNDMTSTVYQGNNGLGTYSYELTINSDGTGEYVLTKTKSGTTTVYHQFFKWTDAGSGKLNIVKDEEKTSTLCTTDNYNLWMYWSGDSASNKNTITISGDTATFKGMYSNNTSTKDIVLTIVK